MRQRAQTRRLALCGMLAALAVAVMFLGGVLPFATMACPVLASLVLIPVYAECGKKWGFLWYGVVAVLSLMLTSDKESGILFVFFGCYPLLRHLFGHLHAALLRRAVKFLYVNASIGVAYGLMLFVFRMEALTREFAETEKYLLVITLVLANIAFFLCDVLIARLEIIYHAKLRSKLKL